MKAFVYSISFTAPKIRNKRKIRNDTVICDKKVKTRLLETEDELCYC